MNPSKPDHQDRKNDIICHCSGTTEQQIMELIDNGTDNLESIARMTGASSGCGACEDSVLELLAEHPFKSGIK
ncbi:MAG: (2Fe-2S)-binding protein [Methylobacter sp.]